MSFTIDFQINSSENNRLDKTTSTVLSLSGTLKEGTSIVNPVILVEASPATLAVCNYAVISVFNNRRYFITDVQSYRNALTEVHMKCDVLSTYASQIRNCEALIYKQENIWNLYLDDGTFKAYQNPMLGGYEFPNGFNTLQYILSVAGH